MGLLHYRRKIKFIDSFIPPPPPQPPPPFFFFLTRQEISAPNKLSPNSQSASPALADRRQLEGLNC